MTETGAARKRKSRSFKAAVVFLAVVMVAGCVLVGWLLLRRGDTAFPQQQPANSAPTDGTPAVPVSAPPSTSPTPNGPPPSVCGLVPGDQTTPLRAPDVSWVYEGALGFPVSETAGPGIWDAAVPRSVPRCFADSPLGAVMFASNAALRVIGASDKAQVLSLLVADGPFKAAQVAEATDPATPSRVSLFGFKVLAFAPSRATVDVVIDASVGPDAIRLSLVMSLVWVDGDWFLSGDLASPVSSAEARSLSTYVQWVH